LSWIRLDCSALDDKFLIDELSGDEFKAWTLFLLRVKAVGARGSVPITSTSMLARSWNLPESSIKTMIEKAYNFPNGYGEPGKRIYEHSGRWYVRNWKKYQEDYGSSRGLSSGISEDGTERTTPQDPTLQDPTLQDPTVSKVLLNNKKTLSNAKKKFETIWLRYPNRQGKKNARRHFNATVKTEDDWAAINRALDNYLRSERVKKGFVKNGSTWFNEWQDWVNPSHVMMFGGPVISQQWTCPKCGQLMAESKRVDHDCPAAPPADKEQVKRLVDGVLSKLKRNS